MSNYKSNSFDTNNVHQEDISASQIQINELLLQRKRNRKISLFQNPTEFFRALEQFLATGNNENIIRELSNFNSLASRDDFKYYPSFSSSNLPAMLISMLHSRGNNFQPCLILILKIIVNLTSNDILNYCKSFSDHTDMIKLSFDLFEENFKSIPEISSLSISLFNNFTSSSKYCRDRALDYILQIIKHALTKQQSKLKENIFTIVLNLTHFEINMDYQFMQIQNAILLLVDYIDESTSLVLTLTLRELSYYTDIYKLFNDCKGSKILNFLAKNLTSSIINLVYLTLRIFHTIYSKNEFTDIPLIPSIIKHIESKCIEIVQYACLTLTAIVENSPSALCEKDAHIIVSKISEQLINGKEGAKQYLLICLSCLFEARNILIQDVQFPSFFSSLTKILDSDNESLLYQAILLIIIIISDEKKRDADAKKPLIEYFLNEEAHSIINELTIHENEGISLISQQLSNVLNFS